MLRACSRSIKVMSTRRFLLRHVSIKGVSPNVCFHATRSWFETTWLLLLLLLLLGVGAVVVIETLSLVF